MRLIRIVAFFAGCALGFVACHHDEAGYRRKLDVEAVPTPDVVFDRYEEVLFHLDTARFQEELKAIQQDYLPFLAGDLSDPEAVRYLKDFAVDETAKMLYDKVKEHYPDLKAVEKPLREVLGRFQAYYPEFDPIKKVYTCVSGLNPEVPPVLVLDGALVVSLDWFLDGDEVYERIGMPQYRSVRTDRLSLVKEVGQQLYDAYIAPDRRQTNLLEEMVEQGRRDFFVEALYPSITEEALLGYSKEQLQWTVENEGNLWADVVGNQLLYSSDFEVFRTFFADGPFTNEYSYDAPARLGEFLGLRIVRSYFGKNETTLQELMQTRDLQGLFLNSGYKPKK